MDRILNFIFLISLFASLSVSAQSNSQQVVDCPAGFEATLVYQYSYTRNGQSKNNQSLNSRVGVGWSKQNSMTFVACTVLDDEGPPDKHSLTPIYQYMAPDGFIGQNKFLLSKRSEASIRKSFGNEWRKARPDPLFYLWADQKPGLHSINVFDFTYTKAGYAEIYLEQGGRYNMGKNANGTVRLDSRSTPSGGWHDDGQNFLGYTVPIKTYERTQDYEITSPQFISLKNVGCLTREEQSGIVYVDADCKKMGDKQFWTTRDPNKIKSRIEAKGQCLEFNPVSSGGGEYDLIIADCSGNSNQHVALRQSGRLVVRDVQGGAEQIHCLIPPAVGKPAVGKPALWTMEKNCDGEHSDTEKWTPTTTGDFVMTAVSDPQIGYCQSDYCKQVYRRNNNTEENASIHANGVHARSIKELIKDVTESEDVKFLGVIMNGDLTHLNSENQWIEFKEIYEPFNTTIPHFLGLGNHELGGYNDGNEDNTETMADSIDHLKRLADNLPIAKKDDLQVGSFDWFHEEQKGSLDYYWDIGDFRFIQLQNYPDFCTGDSDSCDASIDGGTITQGWDYLNSVLDHHETKKKNVILNMHRLLDDSSMEDGEPGYLKLADYLDKHTNIRAIFAGHLHQRVGDVRAYPKIVNGKTEDLCKSDAAGQRTWIPTAQLSVVDTGDLPSTLNPPRQVPVLFGGGAECGHYLKLTFKNSSLIAEPIFTNKAVDGNYSSISLKGSPVPYSKDITWSP